MKVLVSILMLMMVLVGFLNYRAYQKIEQRIKANDEFLSQILPDEVLKYKKTAEYKIPEGYLILNGPGSVKVCDEKMEPTNCENKTLDELKVDKRNYLLWLSN